jgi:hypothetical protein
MNLTFKPRKSFEVMPPLAKECPKECPEEWPCVVAFIGPAGCGKSTAAAHLVEGYGYSPLKFAHPIKQMLRVIGLEDRHLEGEAKEIPCDLLGGVSPRRAMQALGTEWGRTLIHPDIWVSAWMREAVWRLQNGQRIVIDDLRYPNELDAILRLGGVTIRIVRKEGSTQCPDLMGHDSETQNLISQRVVVNDSGLAEFTEQITRCLESLSPALTHQAA